MRLYKILDKYIDLDHVLMVSELKNSYVGMGEWEPHTYNIWFELNLMFREKPFIVGINTKYEEREKQINEFKELHHCFIEVWVHKPRKKEKVQQSGHGFVPSGVKIMRDGPYLYLLDEQGNPFKNQISCTIKDRVNKPTIAIIKANVSEIINKEDHG